MIVILSPSAASSESAQLSFKNRRQFCGLCSATSARNVLDAAVADHRHGLADVALNKLAKGVTNSLVKCVSWLAARELKLHVVLVLSTLPLGRVSRRDLG